MEAEQIELGVELTFAHCLNNGLSMWAYRSVI